VRGGGQYWKGKTIGRSPVSRRRVVVTTLAGASLSAAAPMARAAEPAAAPAISIGLTPNPRTRAIIDGRAVSPRFPVSVASMGATDLFLRQLQSGPFDVAEMSISSLLMAMSRGDRRFVALPIFTTRYFFHTGLLVRRDAGIRRPQDLKGRRVGVPEYQQTGALWVRGVLQDEFGVGLDDVEHWMERRPGGSHASAIGYSPPPTVRQIPESKSLGSMMLSGELDAAMMYFPARSPSPTNRSVEVLDGDPRIATLFEDPYAEGLRYFAKTGFHPINHCVVVRRDLLERRPGLAAQVFELFERANEIADADRLQSLDYHYQLGAISPQTHEDLRRRLVHYGITKNRPMLEAILRYSHEQGLTPRRMTIAEVFAANGTDA
jgi:4,5-dihydroxyphthalate decarboxylase